MIATIVWALLTGAVTGGAWVAIVLLRRQRPVFEKQSELVEDVHHRLEQLEHVQKRLTEVEERLDFAERLLAQQREVSRLPSPGPR